MYKVKDNSNPLYKTNINEAITYDFYNEQDVFLAGFNGFKACRPIQKNHKMDLIVEWYGNCFYSEENLNLNADIYKFVRIGLKNESNLIKSKIYFITDTDDEWNEKKSVSFKLRSNDAVYYTYSVPISENPFWKGKIKQLKFCPLDYELYEHIKERKYGDFGITLSYDFIQFATEDLNPGALSFPFKYDMENFEAFGGEAKVFEYMMRCTAKEKVFYLQSPLGLRLSPKNNRYLRVRQKTDSKSKQGIVAYTTANDKVFSDDKQFFYTITDNNEKFVEYTIDLSSIQDELWQIRLYPLGEEVGYCEIDYLVFDTLETMNIELKLPKKIECNRLGDYVEAEGFFANATTLKYVHINMQNNTLSYNAYIQWITDKDNVYDERKMQRFLIRPMDNELREYTVGLNQNQYWRDNIIGLRIVPAEEVPAEEANVIFGEASICRDGDTMSQYRDIVEGYIEYSSNNLLDGWFFERSGGDIHGYISPQNVWKKGGNLENDTTLRSGKLKFINKGNGKETSAYRHVFKQDSGIIDWRFSFQIDNPNANGMFFSLQNGLQSSIDKNVLTFDNNEGYLCANGEKLIKLVPYDWYDVRVLLDLDNAEVAIKANEDFEQRIPLKNAEFDTVRIFATGKEALNFVVSTEMYKVGYLWENSPQTIQSTAVQNMPFIRKAKGLLDFECSFFLEDVKASASLELCSKEFCICGLQIKDNRFLCTDKTGKEFVLWENYKQKVWYSCVIKVNTVLGTADFRINGQTRAKNVAVNAEKSSLTNLRISTDTGHLTVRGIRVKPHIYSTVPYIDKVPSKTGLVGMQAWFDHGSFWNRTHNQFYVSDKTPYIGHYDDMNINSVDWQVKFLSEHGVDFICPFFYTNLDAPAYQGNNFTTTFLRYSEQHEKLNFCVIIGEIFQTMTREKMLNNVLPFLIENYFKHPSYMKVDNKPVLMAYSWDAMMKHMTPEGINELLQEMNVCLKKEGFNGIVMIGQNRPHLDGTLQRDLSDFVKSGVDRLFAYCNIYTEEASRGFYERTSEAGIKSVKCMGSGWDNRYWCPVGGYFIVNNTPSQFENAMKWMTTPSNTTDQLDDMIILDNWSEFGEGHSIQPTNLYGFGYLNAIRKLFTDADETHYDNVPEGALNALHVNGSYPDFEEKHIVCSRWAMPPWYESKYNIHRTGD